MPRLKVVGSKVATLVGREYDVGAGATTIGRAPENQVVVDDDGLSRVHARLTTTAGGIELSDNGSANGIWVDGQRVARVILRPGLQITMASTTFELVEGDHKATVLMGHNIAAYPELAAAQQQQQSRRAQTEPAAPPPYQAAPPPPYQAAPPPRRKVWPFVVIGVLVLGGAGAFAIIAARSGSEKTAGPGPTPAPTPMPTPTPTPTPMPAATPAATFQAGPGGIDYAVTQPGSPIDRVRSRSRRARSTRRSTSRSPGARRRRRPRTSSSTRSSSTRSSARSPRSTRVPAAGASIRSGDR